MLDGEKEGRKRFERWFSPECRGGVRGPGDWEAVRSYTPAGLRLGDPSVSDRLFDEDLCCCCIFGMLTKTMRSSTNNKFNGIYVYVSNIHSYFILIVETK